MQSKEKQHTMMSQTPVGIQDQKSRKSNPHDDNQSFKTDKVSVDKQIGNDGQSEGEEDEDDRARKILDRSQLMDHMLFPENGPTLVIVPSNKQGTGFLNHCYDEQYLKDHI